MQWRISMYIEEKRQAPIYKISSLNMPFIEDWDR